MPVIFIAVMNSLRLTKVTAAVVSVAVAALFFGSSFVGCCARPPMECDREAMYATIEALCADSMSGRRTASGGDLRAVRMLSGMMEQAGCEPLWDSAIVPFHLYDAFMRLNHRWSDESKSYFPGPWRDSTYNVAMVIRSGYPDAPKVLLGAHYDHMGKVISERDGMKDTLMLRGANDNASGAAAVVEIARRLRPYARDFKRDLVVALFGAEEQGVVGSRYLAAMLRDSAVNVGYMVNLEMLGRLKEDNFRMYLFVDDMEAMKQISVPNVDSLSVGVVMKNSGLSDHLSFAGVGIPSSMFATDDYTTLHRETDTPESLNMEGMERVVNYIIRNVYALLTAERLPAPNEIPESE